jgi:hypothetical protein
MSSGPKTRKSTGPTSPRGIYSRSVAAPGMSLDMPDEKPVKKMRSGGMPDLTGDGKVTRADVLKGRGVFKHGGKINKMAEGGMTDEEKYGKVGAEIRRLDPEAYKNRKDRSAEANLRLLKELREKSRGTRKMSTKEFIENYEKSDTPAGRVTKTETKVEMPTSSGARSGGRGSKPGSARVGSGRYDDPTSSYGERVTAPLRAFSDIFGRRREEDVMKNMGVDRVEAARRLANLDKVRKSEGMKHGGDVKKYAKGGSVSSASRRADGIAKKGKTKGRMV